MRKQLGLILLGLILIILVINATYVFAVSVLTQTSGGQAGTTLSATVTATGYWKITYRWTIDKSVTPETWHLFKGDSGTSRFTITVTKDEGTEEAWVEGQVCVTNGGGVATENLKIVIKLRNGLPPPDDLIATVTVDVSGNPVLDPGETGCYPYRVDIPSEHIHAGGTYKVTACVTITNHSGHLNEPFGPSPSDTTNLPGSPTLVYNVIHVDDDNVENPIGQDWDWEFSASGSVTYEKTFTCADEGENVNTATIRETGQYDSTTVTVNCYELEVTKTAVASFTRTYSWTIDKTGDQTNLKLKTGETSDVNYEITVDATYADSDWAVTGTITVYNPAPIPVTINSITDVVSPDIEAKVNFGVTFPYTLEAEGTLTGTYSASLPDASTRINTATVTIQNYDYDYLKNPTSSVTTDFTGTADVVFTSATILEVDKSIDVSDTYAGFLGTVTYGKAPKTFTYSRPVGPYSEPGEYTVENTASFVTCDTGATGIDSWTVTVVVSRVVEYCYETAYGKGYGAICFIPTFSNWGWTNYLPGCGEYTFDLWAGAGQCDTSKGTLVGTVRVTYGEGSLNVEFNVKSPYILVETHVYAGSEMFPQIKVGKRTVNTVAPGQYYIDYSDLTGNPIYVIVHAVVGIPCTP